MSSNLSSLSDNDRYTYDVGMLTRVWASIDAILDGTIAATFSHFGGNQHHGEIPRALKKNIDLLKRTFKASDELADIRPAALFLLQQIVYGAQTRNAIIHSVAVGSLPNDLKLFRIRYLPMEHRRQEIPVTLEKTNEAINEALKLSEMAGFVLAHCASLKPLPGQIQGRELLLPMVDHIPDPKGTSKKFLRLLGPLAQI